ncbi:DNA polymerase III subunit gamma/tau [Gilliamella sp. Pra-s65]|uniref:DNA polymerase III subunit gamma/tau n=1 Tax=unclassified Gilliamella TaxID=2685620 RepID=UPI001365A040|nr:MULTISPECIES: DNA polymerase III subunit gamma/tau [unclassified Gilliamella]MWN90684.1 DNA polymerase III subunit gamma/tau [Gilliamella sp. Pra-s65]MWP73623.1 DNA polymerase III subunit gamma/tau [Gilliamella sp. Pra-s52]
MSYQVLARKWRPKSFSEVVGQEHVLKILSNALSLGRVHHAYLFSGTRGVGKTSIARLLAKGLNCETGITATPCGVCDNCRDIEQGRFVDLLEIDAASRTKVEDTREILDNIQYLPTKGRFKVYLIDEVHMLSRSSFNALLKTLEEPPEHVKFLLATTDPQKLPITILSRCLHLHLNVLDSTLISKQLDHILQLEQISHDPKGIGLLAKAANGSMRDALSLTDQAIALGNGKVDAESVSVMLGTLDKSIPFSLLEALHHCDGNALMQQIESAAIQGADWDNLLAETITLLHQIALLQVVPTALGDYTDNEERIRFLAQYMAPNDVQLFYQILLMGRKELAFAPDKKIGVEMSFLRALAFMPKDVDAVVPPTALQPQSQTQTQHQSQTQSQAQVQVQTMGKTNVSKQAEGNKSVNSQTQISHATTPAQTTKAPQVSQLGHNSVNHSEPVKPFSLEAQQSALGSPLSEPEQPHVSSKPAHDKSLVASPKVEQTTKSGGDDLAIPDEVSSVTKSILEMRMQLMKEEQNPKKSKAVDATKAAQPKSSVINASLERIKQNSVSVESVNTDSGDSRIDNDDEEEEITAENYQWQASGLIPMKEELVVDTKAFRESLNGEKTPEMTKKLIAEMAQKDAWCAEIEQLDLSPLIKQIVVNSFFEQTDDGMIVLHLRSSVKHLINSISNVIKVKKALCKHRNQELDVNIIIDDDLNYKTPIEMREELYQEKLAQAKIAVAEDPKVATICRYFDAKIDEASVRPV